MNNSIVRSQNLLWGLVTIVVMVFLVFVFFLRLSYPIRSLEMGCVRNEGQDEDAPIVPYTIPGGSTESMASVHASVSYIQTKFGTTYWQGHLYWGPPPFV